MANKPRPRLTPAGKLTPERTAEIIGYVQTGLPLEVAAQAGGISPSTFWDWMAAGEGRASDITPSDATREFAQGIRRAEARAHHAYVKPIKVAADEGNWQAGVAFARMRYSRYYAERAEVTGGEGEPLTILNETERALLRKAIDEYLVNHPDEELHPDVPGPEGGPS